MTAPGFHIVIPARMASERLPGKPLAPIAGRPLIEHVFRRAEAAGARSICIATDDERIAAAARAFDRAAGPPSSDGTRQRRGRHSQGEA